MIFNEEPLGITGASSPIIYQAYDPLYASAGFYYKFDVFVWSGSTTLPLTPIATIERKPDQYGDGRAWVDIHKLVQQYITSEFLVDGTYKPNIGGGAYYCAVKVQGIYDSGTTGQITSNTLLATNGYNYTFDGLNANYSNKVVYTDIPKIIITLQTPSYYIWYNASVVTSIVIGGYSITPNTVSTSDTKIQGVDIIQLIQAAGTSGEDVNLVVYSTAMSPVTIPIEYNCQNKYGEVDVHFLNKYGVYDSLVFNALSREVVNITKEQYEKPIYRQADLNTAWSYGVQITTPYHTNGMTQLTINTDYMAEAFNESIQQFLMSNNILIIDGDVVSARIIDSAFNKKTIANDKLIQYTFTLEYNQPVINKIVR